VVNRRQGHRRPRLIDALGEQRLAYVVRSNRQATVAQIAQKVNAVSDRKVSEHTVHHSLLCMELHSLRPVRVPMLTPVHHRKCQQWASELDHRAMEECGLVLSVTFWFWSVTHMAPGCIYMGRRLAGRGSVMLKAMFFWETRSCHPCGCYFDTYHCIVADMYTLSWNWYSFNCFNHKSLVRKLARIAQIL